MRSYYTIIRCATMMSALATQSTADDLANYGELCETPCGGVHSASIFASTEYLSWKSAMPGNDFAITESRDALILGQGDVHHVSMNTNPGFRAQLGYQTKAGWSIAAEYTYFDASATSTINRPDGNGRLFSTLSHPDGNYEAETVTGLAGLDYNVFDVIIQKPVMQTSFSDVRLFGGIRWANIDQLLSSSLDGRDFSDGIVENTTSSNGAGIRMGSESNWLLANGFYLHGRVSGGLLFAETSTRLLETNFSGQDVLVDINNRRDESLPFVNTRLGVGWKTDSLSALVGYELENWFGLSDRAMFSDNIHQGSFAPIREDLLLSGLFVRFSVAR